jgi:hypothetical protein
MRNQIILNLQINAIINLQIRTTPPDENPYVIIKLQVIKNWYSTPDEDGWFVLSKASEFQGEWNRQI